MSELEVILLGALQGVTEFLPISSSGHLKLGAALLGIKEPELLFDITLHVGSLMAVLLIYRKALAEIFRDLLKGAKMLARGESWRQALALEGNQLSLFIVLATIPTGVIGLFLDKLLEGPTITTAVVGAALIVNGGILLMSRRAQERFEARPEDTSGGWLNLWGLGLGSVLLIGVAQGIAVMPGLSRAGLTITVCLLLGVERENAARFSFLLSIPAILGALVLKFDPSLFTGETARLANYAIGAFVAFLVGVFSLVLLIQMLRKAQFHHFSWYCFAVGASAILFTLGTI